MTASAMLNSAGCIRTFKYRVLAGQEEAYRKYLADVVDPIDEIAHADGAFLDVVVMSPDDPEKAGWTQCRVFTFKDAAQRAAFPALIAKAATALSKPWAMPIASREDRDFATALGISFMAITDERTALRDGMEASLRNLDGH